MKKSVRGGAALLCALPFLFTLGACSNSVSDELKRSFVEIKSVEVTSDGLNLSVDSCGGSPIALVSELELEVRISVTAAVINPGNACLDQVDVPLDAPLGDRNIIDLYNDQALPVNFS